MAQDALHMVVYEDNPSVLLIADGAAAARRGAEGVARAGCRLAATVSIDDALDRLERQVAIDAVLLEVDGDSGAPMDAIVDRMIRDATEARYGGVVSTPPALVDAVAARGFHDRFDQLCEPDDATRTAAIASAARPHDRLRDVKDDRLSSLQQLSEEVGRIASALAELSVEAAGGARNAGESGAIDPHMLRAMIRVRRMRDQFFHPALFADPAWDMLLDLMAARLEGRRVAVSSLCIAAAVPPTTALRWIKTLTQQGLFVRTADPEDGRRVYIALSDAAAAAFEAWFRAMHRLSPLMPKS